MSIVNAFSLNFSSGNNPGFNPTTKPGGPRSRPSPTTPRRSPRPLPPISTGRSRQRPDPDDILNQSTTGVSDSPTRTTTSNIQAPPVTSQRRRSPLTTPWAAYSQHPGRIYVAYTGRFGQVNPTIPAADTEINLVASDDGGQTWSAIDPDALGTWLFWRIPGGSPPACRSTTPTPITDGFLRLDPRRRGAAGDPAAGGRRSIRPARSSSRTSTPATTRPRPGSRPTSR